MSAGSASRLAGGLDLDAAPDQPPVLPSLEYGCQHKEGGHVTTRRAQTSHDSCELILAVAAELFAEKGYRQTTFGDVAMRSGISGGSIPWHFGSKEGLLLAVLERSMETFRTGLVRGADRCQAAVCFWRSPAAPVLPFVPQLRAGHREPDSKPKDPDTTSPSRSGRNLDMFAYGHKRPTKGGSLHVESFPYNCGGSRDHGGWARRLHRVTGAGRRQRLRVLPGGQRIRPDRTDKGVMRGRRQRRDRRLAPVPRLPQQSGNPTRCGLQSLRSRRDVTGPVHRQRHVCRGPNCLAGMLSWI
ncbi:helix-turn-helix domain-containing protein [Nonomuraea sp. NPDC005692]|uniref:TetR/AcrR family transcriptional regulator n=1 Tax=Nonomuraea sp. NPDC005692 TaxID=3157168 RepID=UPI0033FAE162